MTRGIWIGCAVLAGAMLAGCATLEKPQPVSSSDGLELTALDRYVHAPDPNYRYALVKTIDGEGYTGYVIDMVSQQWLTEQEVDRPIWQHWLVIVKPDNVTTKTGMLFIGGGKNGNDAPDSVSPLSSALALGTGSVVADLSMVPNQPLTFAGETVKRSEDSIIAYTWDHYMKTGDERWPLRLPMTKSAVRAMDTMTSFMASDAGGKAVVDKFVVAGGSKRGWTTWTTAAVDERVIAVCPLVIDALNIIPSFMHHYEVYGRYADAVGDYNAMHIMEWSGTPEYERLMQIEEPYEYRKRLTLPKYIVNSTGDQFFLPDSSQFYWDGLIGEKYLRYVPNAEHSLSGTDVPQSVLAWYHAIVNNVPRPRYTWDIQADGAIRVFTMDTPSEVRLWRASNEEARNFQKAEIGAAWSSVVLSEHDHGTYIGNVEPPAKGWTAYFVELTYPSGTSVPFKFTTEVKVTPDTKAAEYKMGPKHKRPKGFLSK